jgi:hypothetical protein
MKPHTLDSFRHITNVVVGYFAFLFIVIAAALMACLFSGCATTTFYSPTGMVIARFQGDMQGVEWTAAANGAQRWKAAAVDHSHATVAGGQAFSKGALSLGTAVASSGAVSLLK